MGMFNSSILDVLVGLIFVYMLLAILCTAANEWIASLTRRRGETLRRGITQLLEGQGIQGVTEHNGFLDAFYNHPLIQSLMHDDKHPTYLSPRTFAAVVTDLLTLAKPGSINFSDLEAGGLALPDGQVKRSVLALMQRSNKQLEVAQNALEGWFNDSMDRVSGWYKRRTQIWTLVLAFILTVVANADTIQIVRKLWQGPAVRAAVVEQAKARAAQPRPAAAPSDLSAANAPSQQVQLSDTEKEMLGDLIGWHGTIRDNLHWSTFIGWMLTTLALTLGAPFWFDFLNKFMNIRFAGRSPNEGAKGPEKTDSQPRV
jgi:hypothetical protein